MRQVRGKVGSFGVRILIASGLRLVHGEPPCAANRAPTAAEATFCRRAVMVVIVSFVTHVADGFDGGNGGSMRRRIAIVSRLAACLSNTAAI